MGVRLNAEERSIIEQRAKAVGMAPSAYVKHRALGGDANVRAGGSTPRQAKSPKARKRPRPIQPSKAAEPMVPPAAARPTGTLDRSDVATRFKETKGSR